MALVLEVILGLAILASFYVAYMSARTWQVYQVVAVVFVFLGSVTFFYLAAGSLATHKAWREKVKTFEADLAKVQKDNQDIVNGGFIDANGQPGKGINQLKAEIKAAVVDRGGALFDVAVEVLDGEIKLTPKSPDHGLVPNSVVFIFDQKKFEEGGRYQGEFKVVAVAEDKTTLTVAPNLPLTEAQSKRLAETKGPWTMYTTMPVDSVKALAGLDDKAKAAVLPAESLAEYSKPDRQLRDYQLLFRENFVQRALLADDISKVTNNIARTTANTQEAEKEASYRTEEGTNLKADLEKFKHEQAAIAGYFKSLEQLMAQVRQTLRTKFAENKQWAAALTNAQWKAAEEINQRTAQAAP